MKPENYKYLQKIKGAISLRYLSKVVLGKSATVVVRAELGLGNYTKENLLKLSAFFLGLSRDAKAISDKMAMDAEKMPDNPHQKKK